MKRFAVSIAFAMLSSCALLGQQESSNTPDSTLRPTSAQVSKFIEVMQVRQRLQISIKAQKDDLKTTTHNMFRKALPDATSEEKAKFEAICADALGGVFTNYPIDEVLRDLIPIYQSHFTESDLNQIVGFYSSPIGQKVLKEMPAVSAETIRITNIRLQPKMDEMMKNLSTRLQEMVEAENGKNTSK
jgi:uncharacterized protein